jgi:hypothetical protein
MNLKPKKLVLNQETLKILSGNSTNKFASHTCTTPTACSPFSCTVAPC